MASPLQFPWLSSHISRYNSLWVCQNKNMKSSYYSLQNKKKTLKKKECWRKEEEQEGCFLWWSELEITPSLFLCRIRKPTFYFAPGSLRREGNILSMSWGHRPAGDSQMLWVRSACVIKSISTFPPGLTAVHRNEPPSPPSWMWTCISHLLMTKRERAWSLQDWCRANLKLMWKSTICVDDWSERAQSGLIVEPVVFLSRSLLESKVIGLSVGVTSCGDLFLTVQ